jgi:hypothetical protein
MESLRAALAEPVPFQPDWSLLEATQESLREHMEEVRRLRAALAEPVEYAVEPNGKRSPLLTHMMNKRTKEDTTLAAAVAEPVAISVVAVAEVVDREDGPELNWLLEGGIYELPAGVVLLMSYKPLTDADGHGHVYAAPPQREPQWVPVAERLPPSGQTVLACYMNRAGRLRRIRAEWIAAKSVESNSEHSDIGVYDEATDTFYDPEGWYERIDNWGDYLSVVVCEGDVTHWMPMPAPPTLPGLGPNV